MSLPAFYQCLSNEDRLRIVGLLSDRALCVQELQTILQLSQVEVSKHLAFLRRHRFVEAAKAGTWRIYRLPDDLPFEVANHLRCLRECIDHGKLLKEEFDHLRAVEQRERPGRRRKEVSRPPVQAVDNAPGVLEDHLL